MAGRKRKKCKTVSRTERNGGKRLNNILLRGEKENHIIRGRNGLTPELKGEIHSPKKRGQSRLFIMEVHCSGGIEGGRDSRWEKEKGPSTVSCVPKGDKSLGREGTAGDRPVRDEGESGDHVGQSIEEKNHDLPRPIPPVERRGIWEKPRPKGNAGAK